MTVELERLENLHLGKTAVSTAQNLKLNEYGKNKDRWTEPPSPEDTQDSATLKQRVSIYKSMNYKTEDLM